MNADLKRVRADDSSTPSSPAKRRAMSVSSNAPPSASEGEGGVEEWQAVVEVKRKEAIYRQMLEYRRMHEREVKRANELEAQKRVLEASVQAVEVCWSQLVSVMRDLTGQSTADAASEDASEPIIDPSLSRPELDSALSQRLPSTRKLISSFVESSKNGISPAVQDLHTKCSKLQAESSTLKSRNRDLQAQVASLSEEKDTAARDLLKAQKALDRQRMEFDKAQDEWKARDRDRDKDRERDLGREGSRGSATPNAGKANGSGHATPNGKVENDEKPFDGTANTGMLLDTTELEEKAASRLKALEALRAQHTALQQEYDQLKISSATPTEQALRDSPFFQIYLHQLATHFNRANDLQQRYDGTEKKLDELRSNNQEFREAVLAEGRAESEQLRAQIAQKNTDLTRLRGQRDEKEAELLERRTKEGEKLRYAEEVEVLAKTREERIVWLESEIKRLKGRLGAESGSLGYLTFLRGDGGVDGDYVRDLEEKLSDAQTRLSAWAADKDTSVATTRAELDSVKAKLLKYERVLGPNPDVASDVQELARQLKQAQEDRQRLALQVQEAEEATNALYAEMEGLSKLCDETTKTMSQKTYELKDSELKMSRLATEKAKANNKYFAAMQTKEVLEQETRSMQRTVDKQSVLLQKAQEVERGLNAQIAAHEKGLIALKNSSLDLQSQLAQIASEKAQLEHRLSQAQATLAEAQKTMHQRVADYAAEKASREKLQEEVDEKQRKIEKLKERHEAMVGASSGKHGVSATEYALQQERDKLFKLLRCSCCNLNFKQQVITRCMHTFCKGCLDDRIASRQRKCPACGVAFSKEEVQTIYWQ